MYTSYKIYWLATAVTYFILIFSHSVDSSAATDQNKSPRGRARYAMDPEMTRRLALLEDKLYINLAGVWESIEESSTEKGNECYVWLSTYLNEFEEDIKASRGVIGEKRASTVADNPILIFKMIRRIFSTILSNTVPRCNIEYEVNVGDTVKDVFKQSQLLLPTRQDWNDALLGIMRIQFVYGFDAVTQLRLGIFNETHTNVTLWFDDCMALGRQAVKMKAEVIAHQWLTSASLCLKEKKFTDYQKVQDIETELNVEWENLMKLVNVETMYTLNQLLQNKHQIKMKPLKKYEHYSTCRGESDAYTKPELFCFNQWSWDPYFMINPIKTEVLSVTPPLYQLYDFIGERAINHIRESAAQILVHKISHPEGYQMNDFRTSLTSYQDPNNLDPVMLSLSRKTEKVTRLEVMKNLSSVVQMTLYGSLGGHYDFHHDSLQASKIPLEIEGDRIATFTVFISDVKMGGNTAFDNIGVSVNPIKGSAIFWYNLHPTGEPDLRMYHTGCPVVLGSKLVINRWINQYENMWNYPYYR